MAEVIRLQIIYETQQAAAGVRDLEARLRALEGVTVKTGRAALGAGTHLKGMALAGTRLATGLAQGNLSALGLASTLGRLAGAGVAGALVVTFVNLVNAMQEFKRISDDVTNTIDAMQTAARDARADIARLLGEAPAESNAEKAIKRLRDAAASLRKEAARIGGPAGKLLEEQATGLEAQIPGIGQRAATGEAKAKRDKATKATNDYNKALSDQAAIDAALATGPIEALNNSLALQRKRYEELVRGGVDPATDRMKQFAEAITFQSDALEQMQEAQRQQERLVDSWRQGLQSMQGSLEEFLVTGKFVFQQLIDDLLRIAFRAATDQFVDKAVKGVLDVAQKSSGFRKQMSGG